MLKIRLYSNFYKEIKNQKRILIFRALLKFLMKYVYPYILLGFHLVVFAAFFFQYRGDKL